MLLLYHQVMLGFVYTYTASLDLDWDTDYSHCHCSCHHRSPICECHTVTVYTVWCVSGLECWVPLMLTLGHRTSAGTLISFQWTLRTALSSWRFASFLSPFPVTFCSRQPVVLIVAAWQVSLDVLCASRQEVICWHGALCFEDHSGMCVIVGNNDSQSPYLTLPYLHGGQAATPAQHWGRISSA